MCGRMFSVGFIVCDLRCLLRLMIGWGSIVCCGDIDLMCFIWRLYEVRRGDDEDYWDDVGVG